MRTQTSYLLIGTFVIAGFTLLTASIVVLSASGGKRDVIKAETLFDASVSGLEVGAPVRFRGVSVGRVETISVAGALYHESQTTYVVVRFDLWGPEGFPVSRLRETLPKRIAEGLRVRQATTGITGISFLEADILADADKYPPKPRDWMPRTEQEEYLYIPSAPSQIGEVVNTLEKALDEVVRADLPGLVTEIRAAVKGLAAELKSAGIADLRDAAKQALASVRDVAGRAGDQLGTLAADVDRGVQSFTAAADRAATLFGDPRLGTILDAVRQTTASLPSLVESARGTLDDAQAILGGRAGDVTAILANLERVTAQLRALTATAEQYPSWLLFGTQPQPGVGR